MENVRATENDILARLTKAAKEGGVVLTCAHKLFFLRLLDLAARSGEDTDDGYSVSLTVQELAEALRIPLRTTIQSLNRLTACGALLRTDGKKTFPRSPTTTTLVTKFYRRE